MEDLIHGFLANRLLVHSQFIGLGNSLEVVVHYLLIGGMVGLGYWDEFPMCEYTSVYGYTLDITYDKS